MQSRAAHGDHRADRRADRPGVLGGERHDHLRARGRERDVLLRAGAAVDQNGEAALRALGAERAGAGRRAERGQEGRGLASDEHIRPFRERQRDERLRQAACARDLDTDHDLVAAAPAPGHCARERRPARGPARFLPRRPHACPRSPGSRRSPPRRHGRRSTGPPRCPSVVSQPRLTTSVAPTFGLHAMPAKAAAVRTPSSPTWLHPCWWTMATPPSSPATSAATRVAHTTEGSTSKWLRAPTRPSFRAKPEVTGAARSRDCERGHGCRPGSPVSPPRSPPRT